MDYNYPPVIDREDDERGSNHKHIIETDWPVESNGSPANPNPAGQSTGASLFHDETAKVKTDASAGCYTSTGTDADAHAGTGMDSDIDSENENLAEAAVEFDPEISSGYDEQYYAALGYSDIPVTDEKVANLVRVRSGNAGRSTSYDSNHLPLKTGAKVLVEGPVGTTCGTVTRMPCRKALNQDQSLPRVERCCAGHADERRTEAQAQKEKDAFILCKDLINQLSLPMKLVAVEFNIHLNRGLFLFSSENRVDFRQLVRELATQLKCRVDMRQIGVRDESSILGGIGHCGLNLCCNGFLQDFSPVSIRMAKDQNLALNPDKVSGVCGRLMCCLVYEEATYKEMGKNLPKIGKTIDTPAGKGRVREVDVLRQRIRIQTEDGTITVFTLDEINRFRDGGPATAAGASMGTGISNASPGACAGSCGGGTCRTALQSADSSDTTQLSTSAERASSPRAASSNRHCPSSLHQQRSLGTGTSLTPAAPGAVSRSDHNSTISATGAGSGGELCTPATDGRSSRQDQVTTGRQQGGQASSQSQAQAQPKAKAQTPSSASGESAGEDRPNRRKRPRRRRKSNTGEGGTTDGIGVTSHHHHTVDLGNNSGGGGGAAAGETAREKTTPSGENPGSSRGNIRTDHRQHPRMLNKHRRGPDSETNNSPVKEREKPLASSPNSDNSTASQRIHAPAGENNTSHKPGHLESPGSNRDGISGAGRRGFRKMHRNTPGNRSGSGGKSPADTPGNISRGSTSAPGGTDSHDSKINRQ